MERCLGCMNEYDAALDQCPLCGYVKGTAGKSKNHLSPGTILIDRYLIGRCLGQGGFGITYIAWDQRLYKKVAIKEFMPTSLASRITGQMEITCYNEEAQERFQNGIRRMLDESRRLARFNDLESVVKVYDCFEANQTAYIIMELLDGENIKTILAQQGSFGLEETVKLMLPILQALREIHASGLIHRDISPDNIFVCKNGKVKLLDFGSARVASGSDDKSLSVILKPGYAPQEQYSSSAAQGPYTDVYAVCATIYKMLSGVTPIDSLERRSQHDELAPIETLVAMPKHLAQTIDRGLAVEAQDRLQTIDPLLKAFFDVDEKMLQKMPKTPQKKPDAAAEQKKKRLRILLVCAAAAIIVISAAAVIRHFRKPPAETPESTTVETVEMPTDYSREEAQMLAQANAEQTPVDLLPQPASRDEIRRTYAHTLFYTAEAEDLYANYGTRDRVQLREHILLPKYETDTYTLYSYTSDGKPQAQATYRADGGVESATRWFYGENGKPFAISEYTGDALSSVQEIRYDDAGKAMVATIRHSDGAQESVSYSYEGNVDIETHRDQNGKLIYKRLHHNNDDTVVEAWFSENEEEAKTLTRQVDEAGRPSEYTVDAYKIQQQMYTWKYDKNGMLTAHIVLNKKNVQISAFLFESEGEQLSRIIVEKGVGKRVCEYALTGEYVTYETIEADRKTVRTQYAADGRVTGRSEMTCDEDGALIRTEFYDENGKLTGYYADYAYPADGEERYTEYDEKNRKQADYEIRKNGRTIRTYDQAGHVVSQMRYVGEYCTEETTTEFGGDLMTKQTVTHRSEQDGTFLDRTETTYYSSLNSAGNPAVQSVTVFYDNGKPRRKLEYDASGVEQKLTFYGTDGKWICKYSRVKGLVPYIELTFADGYSRRENNMNWQRTDPPER